VGSTSHLQNPLLQTIRALASIIKIHIKFLNIEKQLLDLLFLSSPTSTCKILSREIRGKTQLVPRLHTKYNK
jgi:hypothetical protein